ncbi:cupin [Sphingobium sp. TomTYG75]
MGSEISSSTATLRNLLEVSRGREEHELFEDLLRRPGVRIERIISQGQTTPPDRPYVQEWDEWVLILAGSAEVTLEGFGQRSLIPGDHLFIPAGVPHLVIYTANPTIWLAIHVGQPRPTGSNL